MNFLIALVCSLSSIFVIGLVYGILKFREEVQARLTMYEETIEIEKNRAFSPER